MMNYLKSDTIKLYRFTERYITPQYIEWINNQKNSRYGVLGRTPIINEEVIIPNQQHTMMFAVITELDGGVIKYIGTATLHNIDWVSGKSEIGYMIGDDEYKGKGYATEVVRLLVEYAFNRLGLRKINADVVAGNIASQRVLEKNGFEQWGINPKEFYLEGKYLDNYMYYKLRE